MNLEHINAECPRLPNGKQRKDCIAYDYNNNDYPLSEKFGWFSVYSYTNNHVLIPKGRPVYGTRMYGSFYKEIKFQRDRVHRKEFYIHKNRVVKVDKKEQRCKNEATEHSPGPAHCITKYLEGTYNCTAYMLMADKTKPFCQKETIEKIRNTINDLGPMSEAQIFNKTGCLPHCERDEITLVEIADKSQVQTKAELEELGKGNFTIVFHFEDGSYQLEEEYKVYELNDFIADVGGYLGLLLGHSVLSFYYLSAEWFTDTKIWRALFKC